MKTADLHARLRRSNCGGISRLAHGSSAERIAPGGSASAVSGPLGGASTGATGAFDAGSGEGCDRSSAFDGMQAPPFGAVGSSACAVSGSVGRLSLARGTVEPTVSERFGDATGHACTSSGAVGASPTGAKGAGSGRFGVSHSPIPSLPISPVMTSVLPTSSEATFSSFIFGSMMTQSSCRPRCSSARAWRAATFSVVTSLMISPVAGSTPSGSSHRPRSRAYSQARSASVGALIRRLSMARISSRASLRHSPEGVS
jgi:hypothetical protein